LWSMRYCAYRIRRWTIANALFFSNCQQITVNLLTSGHPVSLLPNANDGSFSLSIFLSYSPTWLLK
jgi:hypothetical protein